MIGVLGDDTDPMVTVMKLEKAPQETYADIGGLDQQIQEIKVSSYTTTSIFFTSYPDMVKTLTFLVFAGICRVTIDSSRAV